MVITEIALRGEGLACFMGLDRHLDNSSVRVEMGTTA